MKNLSLLLFYLVSSTLFGQSFYQIPNPPNHDQGGRGFFGGSVEFQGNLFMSFRDNIGNVGHYQLYRLDYDSLVLIPDPADMDGSLEGYTGAPTIFNDTLYLRYQKDVGGMNIKYFMKYNGTTVEYGPNIAAANSHQDGFNGGGRVFDGKLYASFAVNGVLRCYTLNGTSWDSISVNGDYPSAIYADSQYLYVSTQINSFKILALFDGQTTIYPNLPLNCINPTSVFHYNGETYMGFTDTLAERLVMHKFNPQTLQFTAVTLPSNSGNSLYTGYSGYAREVNNKIYLKVLKDDFAYSMYEFDGVNFTEIQNPAGMNGYYGGLSSIHYYEDSLICFYKDTLLANRVFKYFNGNLTEIAAPQGFEFSGGGRAFNGEYYFKLRNLTDFVYYLYRYGGSSPASSVIELPVKDIRIYPNPTENTLFLDDDSFTSFLEYRILDINGRILKNGQLRSKEIDVSFLPKGVYYIQFIDYNLVKKFIK
jgi:hypothetical protein